MNKHLFRKIINLPLLLSYKIYGINVHDQVLSYPLEKKRVFLAALFKSRPELNTLIETGTFQGDTTEFLKNNFSKIISIELSHEFFLKAEKRFENDFNISILEGDSGDILKKIMHDLKIPCAFWLDGHYSASDTALGVKETPIIEEIEAVLKSPYDHLIAIDDARLFIGRHNYPTMFSLAKKVKEIRPEYSVHIKNDIIIISKIDSILLST